MIVPCARCTIARQHPVTRSYLVRGVANSTTRAPAGSRGRGGGGGHSVRGGGGGGHARASSRPPSRAADAGGAAGVRAVRRRTPPPRSPPLAASAAAPHPRGDAPPGSPTSAAAAARSARPLPIGFTPWVPGAPRRHAWPLFGLADLPLSTPVQRTLAASIFRSGSRYLGDEDTMGVGGGDKGQAPPPPRPWVELAVMGRSNVGKSTLLNALLGGDPHDGTRAFVPMSKTPGTTTRLDFYGCGTARVPALVLVDTPGYGYVSRGQGSHDAWMSRISGYLRTRRAMQGGGGTLLARVTLLLDARLGITDLDEGVLTALDDAALPCHVILTKADTVGDAELESVALRTARALSTLRMPFPVLNAISATSGEGMPLLEATLMQTAKVHRLNAATFAVHRQQAGAMAVAAAAAVAATAEKGEAAARV